MVSDIYQNSDIGTTIVTLAKRTPTSINIDEKRGEELKILAIRKKTTATQLLERARLDLLTKEGKGKK